MYLQLFVGVLFWSLFWCVILCVVSSFCNHVDEEERAGCLAFIVLWMCCYYIFLWLFLTVPWVGLRFVIMVFPDHSHLLSDICSKDLFLALHMPQL